MGSELPWLFEDVLQVGVGGRTECLEVGSSGGDFERHQDVYKARCFHIVRKNLARGAPGKSRSAALRDSAFNSSNSIFKS